MDIMKKIAAKARDNMNAEGVTIAFLGDSVTQGCFEIYKINETDVETVFDKNSAYHSYLSKILAVLYPSVPVNIINAGVSGGSAPHGLGRLERDVLCHKPDLTVVCFGLNDTCRGIDNVSIYTDALDGIFAQLKASGSEVIFMTPNMMNTEISCHIKDASILETATITKGYQMDGTLEAYLEAAKKICKQHGILVCDCYAKWKALYENGADVTELLANKINHPTREMNWLFAVSLIETMIQDTVI